MDDTNITRDAQLDDEDLPLEAAVYVALDARQMLHSCQTSDSVAMP